MLKLIKWIRGYFIFVGVVVTSLFAVGIWFSQYTTPLTYEPLASNAHSLLHWKLDGTLLEHSDQSDPLREFLRHYMGRSSGIYLPDLEPVLRKAAEDPRIKGLFLEYSDLSGGHASFTELKDLLARFRKSGKPVYMWSPSLHTQQLYLASQADQFRVPPSANVEVTGLQMPSLFVMDALSRLGVHVDVIRVGKYKSLFEGLTSSRMTPETKEEYESLVSAYESHAVEVIADSAKRANTKAEVASWFKESIFLPEDMLGRRVVSELGFLSDWQESLKSEQKISFHGFEDYVSEVQDLQSKSSMLRLSTKSPGVALIEAVGKIQMEASGSDEEVITPQWIRAEVEWALKSEEVRSVLLRISSPGGSFLASDLIWREIQKLAAKKPVVVSFGDVAASGGYYMAVPGAKIFAEPTTITGSIGVVMMKPSFDGVGEKLGINLDMISRSERKNIYNPGTRPSEVDLNYLQKSANHSYRLFLNRVSEGRKISPEAVDRVAQGRVWLGSQAKEHGLVDAIGGFQEAFVEAKVLGKFDPQVEVPLLRYEKNTKGFWQCFRSGRGLGRCISEAKSAITFAQKSFLSQQALALLEVNGWLHSMTEDRVQALYLGGKL